MKFLTINQQAPKSQDAGSTERNLTLMSTKTKQPSPAHRLGWTIAAILSFVMTDPLAGVSHAGDDTKPLIQKIPGTDTSFEMLPIPGGTFKMGSPDTEKKRKADEGPQFEVKIEPFYMGKYTVTSPEYDLFLANYHRLQEMVHQPLIPPERQADAVTYPTPMYLLDAGPILDRMGRGGKFPAVIMSQFAARQYCKWISKRTTAIRMGMRSIGRVMRRNRIQAPAPSTRAAA